MKILAITTKNNPLHIYPFPQPIVIFHTLLTPSEELTLPYKPVVSHDFHSQFSILRYYLHPSQPVCFDVLPSFYRI